MKGMSPPDAIQTRGDEPLACNLPGSDDKPVMLHRHIPKHFKEFRSKPRLLGRSGGCLRDAECHSISKQRRMCAGKAQSIAQSTSGLVKKQNVSSSLKGITQQCASHVPRRRLRSVVIETIAEKVLTHSSWLYLSMRDRCYDSRSPSRGRSIGRRALTAGIP